MKKINLQHAFLRVNEYWTPKIIAELNGQHVKVVKLKGQFEWHHHENEDELFWVTKGELRIHLRDRTVSLAAGEMFVVAKGVEHKPEAPEEVELVLFEPISTVNTGENQSSRTLVDPERI